MEHNLCLYGIFRQHKAVEYNINTMNFTITDL